MAKWFIHYTYTKFQIRKLLLEIIVENIISKIPSNVLNVD